jgi:SAM-dependent methyltransferase
MNQLMWGTTKFIPLLFEMLDSVASDCQPGYFLDIPVGTGVFTAGEYSLQPNLEFIAADYSRSMLESALEKVRAEDFGNVMLVRTDVRSLPFSDGTFSGVLTMNGIDAFPENQKALDELVRVLKPNGKLAGSTYVRGERWLTDLVMGRIGSMLGYVSRPVFTEDELLESLESRGISNIVSRKIKSIMFFSGRLEEQVAAKEPDPSPAEDPQ